MESGKHNIKDDHLMPAYSFEVKYQSSDNKNCRTHCDVTNTYLI